MLENILSGITLIIFCICFFDLHLKWRISMDLVQAVMDKLADTSSQLDRILTLVVALHNAGGATPEQLQAILDAATMNDTKATEIV